MSLLHWYYFKLSGKKLEQKKNVTTMITNHDCRITGIKHMGGNYYWYMDLPTLVPCIVTITSLIISTWQIFCATVTAPCNVCKRHNCCCVWNIIAQSLQQVVAVWMQNLFSGTYKMLWFSHYPITLFFKIRKETFHRNWYRNCNHHQLSNGFVIIMWLNSISFRWY